MVAGLRLAKVLPWLVYLYLLLEVIVLTLAFFLLLFNASTDAEFTQWVYRREPADRFLPSPRRSVPVVARMRAARPAGPALHRRPETAPPAHAAAVARCAAVVQRTPQATDAPRFTGARQEDPPCKPRPEPSAQSP